MRLTEDFPNNLLNELMSCLRGIAGECKIKEKMSIFTSAGGVSDLTFYVSCNFIVRILYLK